MAVGLFWGDGRACHWVFFRLILLVVVCFDWILGNLGPISLVIGMVFELVVIRRILGCLGVCCDSPFGLDLPALELLFLATELFFGSVYDCPLIWTPDCSE